MLQHTNYNGHGMVPTTHRWWTSIVNNILRGLGEGRVFEAILGPSGKKMQLRLEQKSVRWLTDVVAMFTEPAKLLMDTYCETLGTDRLV